jgi:hypothetical protein
MIFVLFNSSMTCAISRAGHAYPSGTPECNSVFDRVVVPRPWFSCSSFISTISTYGLLIAFGIIKHNFHIIKALNMLARKMLLEDQELLTLPEDLSSPPDFSGVCVARSLGCMCMFCWSLFDLLYIFFWPLCSSIYGFWLPLWHLQTLLSLTIFEFT